MNEEIKDMLIVSAILFKHNVPVEEAKQIGSYIEKLVYEKQKLKEQLQQKEDIIKKAKEFIKKHNEKAGKLYYKYDNKYLLSEIKEDIRDILKEVK